MARTTDEAQRIRELHEKIGELTMERGFSSGALGVLLLPRQCRLLAPATRLQAVHTPTADFCGQALNDALACHGRPKFFNTDTVLSSTF